MRAWPPGRRGRLPPAPLRRPVSLMHTPPLRRWRRGAPVARGATAPHHDAWPPKSRRAAARRLAAAASSSQVWRRVYGGLRAPCSVALAALRPGAAPLRSSRATPAGVSRWRVPPVALFSRASSHPRASRARCGGRYGSAPPPGGVGVSVWLLCRCRQLCGRWWASPPAPSRPPPPLGVGGGGGVNRGLTPPNHCLTNLLPCVILSLEARQKCCARGARPQDLAPLIFWPPARTFHPTKQA